MRIIFCRNIFSMFVSKHQLLKLKPIFKWKYAFKCTFRCVIFYVAAFTCIGCIAESEKKKYELLIWKLWNTLKIINNEQWKKNLRVWGKRNFHHNRNNDICFEYMRRALNMCWKTLFITGCIISFPTDLFVTILTILCWICHKIYFKKKKFFFDLWSWLINFVHTNFACAQCFIK